VTADRAAHVGRKNGEGIAGIDGPDTQQIFGNGDLAKDNLALTAEEIDGIEE